jgi:biopolymer transport protein TolR
MSGKFSASQRAIINRKSKPKHHGPEDSGGELNIVPFLDIIMNVLIFILASVATIFTATIPVPAPTSGPRSNTQPDTRQRLNITVKVTDAGFIVGAGGGFLAPGCRTVGQASLTVANRATADAEGSFHDYAGLTQCMVAIRQQWATEVEDDHSINVSPNGTIPYGVLVKTVDAVRESRADACRMPENGSQGNYTNADCLFPEVTLGILRN